MKAGDASCCGGEGGSQCELVEKPKLEEFLKFATQRFMDSELILLLFYLK